MKKIEFLLMLLSNSEWEEWHDLSSYLFEKYDINTDKRKAAFMAQAAHESNEFKILEENLNYSESALHRVFGRYFENRDPTPYIRNPEALANFVYNDAYRSNRSKLGNTQAGDGWKFRGRGIFQITGRSNYTEYGRAIGKSVDDTIDYIETKEGAFESACWFWSTRRLNRFADERDINSLTRAINGGFNGLEDRLRRYNENVEILNGNYELKEGSKGKVVKLVQEKLEIGADGIYGPKTLKAIKKWQKSNKYSNNGILTIDQIEQIIN